MDELDRFMSYVEKTDSCWFWKGSKTRKNGHGIFQYDGSGRQAHRFIYEYCFGTIPDGYIICHTCRNKCVNPDHLELGTYKKNNGADRVRDGTLLIGETNPRHKLTAEQVRDIKNSSETQVALARKYNVRQSNISEIKRGKTWSHIV